jgi:hypothetical protein
VRRRFCRSEDRCDHETAYGSNGYRDISGSVRWRTDCADVIVGECGSADRADATCSSSDACTNADARADAHSNPDANSNPDAGH